MNEYYEFDIRNLPTKDLYTLQEKLDEIIDERNELRKEELYNKIKSLEGKYYMNKDEVFKIIRVEEDYTVLVLTCPKKPHMGGFSLIHTLNTIYWSMLSFNDFLMQGAFPITEDIFKNIANYFLEELLHGNYLNEEGGAG